MSPCDDSQAPLVSVCIANYNGMEMIDDCLRTVLNIGHICQELSWAPKVELLEGVSLTWAWLRKAP